MIEKNSTPEFSDGDALVPGTKPQVSAPETPRQFGFPPMAIADVCRQIPDAIAIAEKHTKNQREHHANLQGNPQFWPR